MEQKFTNLRQKHPYFIYHRFKVKPEGNCLKIDFEFEIEPNLHFYPKVIYPLSGKNLDTQFLDNLAFNLGLIEILSYWKATCSPQIIIKAGQLSNLQISWWKDLMLKGMGQFFYTNQIDFRQKDFLEIKSDSNKKFAPISKKFNPKNILVPLGGGKDSLVSLELIKKTDYQPILFILNPTHNPISAALAITKITNQESIIAQRQIDPLLFSLNRQDYLNGHTPFSAYLAFSSLIAAALSNCRQIAISDEKSSNEGNTKYLGREINHQYSKSWEFENKFRGYVDNFLTPDLNFFSLLRPLYELQISKLFSGYLDYFPVFRSCNAGQTTNSWCGNCPKCLFVFATLYPFLEKLVLIKIFGENLFAKKSLLPIAKQLLGEKDFKPFECVGTHRETKVAFWLSLKKAEKEKEIPFLLEYFQKQIVPQKKNWEAESRSILDSWDINNHVPEKLAKLLKHEIRKS